VIRRNGQNPERTLHTFIIVVVLGFVGLVLVCIKTQTRSILSAEENSLKQRDNPKPISQPAELYSSVTVESVSSGSFFVSFMNTPDSVSDPFTWFGRQNFFFPSNTKEPSDELYSLSGLDDKLELPIKIDPSKLSQGGQSSFENSRRFFLRITYL